MLGKVNKVFTYDQLVRRYKKIHKEIANVLLYKREFTDTDGTKMFGLDREYLQALQTEHQHIKDLLLKKRGD